MRPLRFAIIAIVCLAALSQSAVWWLANRPLHPADVRGVVSGMSFSPYARDEDPQATTTLDPARLREDLALVARHADAIRTYGAAGGLEVVPGAAARLGLDVTLGVWIDGDEARTDREMETAIHLAGRHRNIERIIVGNESVYREDIDVEALIALMSRVRSQVSVPVGTAEPWHVWLAHPELGAGADFIGVHVLPYWEGVAANDAIAFLDARLRDLRVLFPDKPILLAEIGWPSDGPRIGEAVATRSNQAQLLRDFVRYAEAASLQSYFLVEAFDQPWKRELEGLAGAYWGIYDAAREAKFSWSGEIADRSGWLGWASLAFFLGLAPLLVTLRLRPLLGVGPALGMTILGQFAGGMLAVTLLLASERYFEAADFAVWGALLAAEILLSLVLATEAIEAALLAGSDDRRPDRSRAVGTDWPMVSIHVPCSNEPADLVGQTLGALARLDYPQFEVIVVDNNTSDSSVSDTIAGYCRALGPRFRFLHLPRSTGYKAGALNRALEITAPDAAMVAVVDSDYIVEPGWLKAAIPHFARYDVAIVQAPQDYRDGHQSGFKSACYWEYRAFFRMGMVVRGEDSAIIQHGTMTLVRRDALAEVGGWDETCVTEDAELGLRLFASGWKSVYLPATFGRGLMPDDTKAYGRQRYRWAFGAMQILRRHAGTLFGWSPSKLGFAQRYHFVAGWLPWIGDGAGIVAVAGSLAWAALAASFPARFEPPEAHFLFPVLSIFAMRQARLWWLYGRHVGATAGQRLAAMVAGAALAYPVAQAVLTGLVRRDAVFRRTPKARPAPKLVQSLHAARAEGAIFLALAASAAILIATQEANRLDVQLWVAVIALQAWPYLASLVFAIGAARQEPLAWNQADIVLPTPVAELKEAAE